MVFLFVELAVVATFVSLAIDSRSAGSRSSFVQRHGISARAIVEKVTNHPNCEYPRNSSQCFPRADVVLRLTPALDTVQKTTVDYPGASQLHANEKVTVLVDPRDHRYAELPGAPSEDSAGWIELLVLAAIFAAIAVPQARSVARSVIRRRRQSRHRNGSERRDGTGLEGSTN
jgi:hypothetical protein